ncbi:reverse transcriptase family protein [Lutimaribacter marinistellae]|uniref:RNA-directed DNA polymerase n=1 Tax=Lutimaribacter marinistellae TaxID=1820329 RepID=A0ABV7TG23_9RHOB
MNKPDITKWQSYFKDIGLRDDLIEAYLPFIKQCLTQEIPPIFERNHLSLLVGRSNDDLMAMAFGTQSFYREFRLKKRSGGYRKIRAPYPSLLEVQQWINDYILKSANLPNCATGFREGYSIIDNAKMHCGRDELLKVDVKDFFPTINFSRVIKVFLNFGYPSDVSFILSRLCTLNGELPQGAASSPMLSNIICNDMDRRMVKLCKSHRLRYTRYADDIAISGKNIPKGVARLFFEIIESEGFGINEKKIRFLKKGERKIVTGLDITTGSPRVTRKFRRDIQRDVYFVWSAGLSSHVARRRIFAPNYVDHLEGRVQFWASVEPENRQMQRTLDRIRIIRAVHGSTTAIG